MPIPHQLTIFCELLDGIPLPYGLITRNVINGLMLENIETTIDPAFLAMRFLFEVNDMVLIKHESSESRRRKN